MNDKNQKKIETPTLTIEDNILKYKDSVIQLSNISRCEIAPEPKKTYPIWMIVGLILGIWMMSKGFHFEGFILFALCCIVFALIFNANLNPNLYLTLNLNSGHTILFSSRDKEFLWKAQEVIINSFNYEEACIINFSQCTIGHNQVGGKGNTINS